MVTNCTTPETHYQAPQGSFVYLDTSRIIKCYPGLNQTYIVVRKHGIENHLLAYDHKAEQMILREEVRGILQLFYPIYPTLMSEADIVNNTDFEKIALGIAMAMNIYHQYKCAVIYFRYLHTYAVTRAKNFKGKRPLGDPDIPKDRYNLEYIFQTYPRNGVEMYSYDGYVFPGQVMEILLNDYQIIEPCNESRIYKGLLTDAWKLIGKP